MTTENRPEPIKEGDDFLTQIRKMRESGLDLYIGLQVTVDLDLLKNELVAHQITGHVIEGDDIQQLYKLALVVLAWFERIAEEVEA